MLDSAAFYALKGVKYCSDGNTKFIEQSINLSDILTHTGKHRSSLKLLLILSENSNLKPVQRSIVHSNLGELFLQIKADALAIKNYQLAISDFKGEKSLIYYWYGNIGTAYLNLDRPDSALFYFEKQNLRAKKHNGTHEVSMALNNMGFGYQLLQKPDSALQYYRLALNTIQSLDNLSAYDSLLIANVQSNLGIIYDQQNNLLDAINYSNKAWSYYINQLGETDNILSSGLLLVELYCKQSSFNKAKEILNHLSNLKDLSVSQQLLICESLIQYETQINELQPTTVKRYTDLLKKYKVEQNKAARNNIELTSEYLIRLTMLENKLQKSLIEKSQAQLKFVENRKRNLQILIVVLLFTAILIIALVYGFVNNRRKQSALKNQVLLKEKENLQYNLKLTEQDLTNFAINLSLKRSRNQEMVEILTKIKKLDAAEIKPQLDSIIKEIKSRIQMEKKNSKFDENFQSINSKFFDKLAKTHPNLTQYEREFCALIRLNLNNKEIANLKGISINSAKVAKYRLKKKLNLTELQDIAVFLQNV